MASRLGGGGARGEEAPSAARKLSEAMRYFEPPPRSPWTFRLAVLGVLLGSLAIVLQAYTLSSRGTFSSASWSSATPALAAPRAPVPPPESTHPPPSLRPPAQIMAEPAKTPPPPPLPNLMIAADASTFAGTDLRVPPPTPAPPTPTPVFIPLSDDVASTLDVIASAAEDGESRRRRKGGRRGGSVGDDSLDAGQPINATERMVSREMDGAANATGLHGGLWNATSEWKGRTGKGRGGKGRGGRGGGGKGQDDGSGGARDGRPNLLLMIADDAATADVGALGGGTSSTPNIDSIWRRGARFTSAHAASPLCTPSRFAVLTGQRPSCAAKATTLKSAATTSAAVSQGPLPAYVPMDSYPRPSRHRTLGHRLGEAGYATGIVGLWHLGAPDPVSPSRDLKRVTETDPAKFAVAAGGKVKRAVTTEYAALQEHVRKVGGFEYAERL